MNDGRPGIGLQLNPTMVWDLGLPALKDLRFDYAELLCDMFAAPLDCGYVVDPVTLPLLEQLRARWPLIAHGNYGGEFGFGPLDDSLMVSRHLQLTHAMKSPWYADHLFVGDNAHSYMWSSPLQFSRRELERVAGRAAALQDRLKLPLLHENAFYYAPAPGSDLAEAEFLAELVRRAGTYCLLDLHNIYANSVNFKGYDPWQFVKTLPLDRVVEIHLAGGQRIEDWYHDLHNAPVPDPVWGLLEHVIRNAPALKAIVLEVQGPGHTAKSRPVTLDWVAMIQADLDRVRALVDRVRPEPEGGRR